MKRLRQWSKQSGLEEIVLERVILLEPQGGWSRAVDWHRLRYHGGLGVALAISGGHTSAGILPPQSWRSGMARARRHSVTSGDRRPSQPWTCLEALHLEHLEHLEHLKQPGRPGQTMLYHLSMA